MDIFKAWTLRFMHIQNRYDGGRNFKWATAAEELSELASDISTARKLMRGERAAWKRELARILLAAVVEERDRVTQCAAKCGEN